MGDFYVAYVFYNKIVNILTTSQILPSIIETNIVFVLRLLDGSVYLNTYNEIYECSRDRNTRIPTC